MSYRYNNRTYRIDDINFNASPEDSFVNSRGESMTFIEYYKNNYGLEIRDSKQPMITSLIKKFGEDKDAEPIKVCLIPELCFLTGLTDSQRADFRVMKDVAVHTRHAPNERQNIMLKLFKSIRENPEALQVLSSWGLKLSEKNLRVDGRLLNPTTLIFGGGFKEVVGPKGNSGNLL